MTTEASAALVAPKPRVDIEPVVEAIRVIAEFNRLDLAKVSLFMDGVPLPIVAGALENFRFTGLSNKDFLSRDWWTGKPTGVTQMFITGEKDA